MRWRTKSPYTRWIQAIVFILILCSITMSPTPTQAQTEYDAQSPDLAGVNVAIYAGNGILGSSYTALTKMFEWMNATVGPVTASQINDDYLDDYDIVVFPGGSETSYSSDLDSDGRQKIKEYVASGGSYFGICGGSTFGAEYLRLFNGFMYSVNEPGASQHLTIMHINQSSTGPNLSGCPENVSLMYWSSRSFSPRSGVSVIPIATYDFNGAAGMIAFEYQNGTVFLSSPHPEYEEGDSRDDTSFGDSLDDPESEWDILLRVSKWLVDASIFEPTTTDTGTSTDLGVPFELTLIAVATIGVIAIAGFSILYRRRTG